MEKDKFKYFLKIEKSYQEGDDVYVQGIASGIFEDAQGQRMSINVLKTFADAINNQRLPLTDAHPKGGPILGDLGEVVEAKVLNDAGHSLFIKARIDGDHPAAKRLSRQIERGKKFAFSVEGYVPKAGGAASVWSSKLKRNITEFREIQPKAISITSEPAYTPSLLEVVSKSYSSKPFQLQKTDIISSFKTELDSRLVKSASMTQQSSNILVKKNTMAEKKDQTTEAITPETIETPTVEVTTTDTELKKSMMDGMSSDPTYDVSTVVTSIMTFLQSLGYVISKPDADGDDDEMNKSKDAKPVANAIEEKPEVELLTKSAFDEGLAEFKGMIESISTVQKSLHDDLEAIKDLPLQKKSKAILVEKSIQDREFKTTGNFTQDYKKLVKAE